MTTTFKFTTTTDFSVVSPDVFATFTSAQVSALSKNQLASLSQEQLYALSASSLAGLKLNLLSSDSISVLAPEQISALTPAQLGTIGSLQAAGLIPDQIGNFTPEQAASFPSKVLTLLNADQIPALNLDFISALPVKTFAALTIKQIPALNADQVAVLTPQQVASFSATQATALSPEVIPALDPKVIGSLAIDAFDSADIEGLTWDQVPFLTSNQLSHLSAQQVAGFNAGQIESMKSSTFKGLSNEAISALTTEAVSGITTAQLNTLDLTVLEIFTPEQVSHFNEDAISWIVDNKHWVINPPDSNATNGIETDKNTNGITEQPIIEKPIQNHAPTGTISIIGNAIESETLSIQNTLNDGDGLSASTPLFRYQWLQNGKAISGATQATYTLSENDIGTAISVKVSYTDGLNKLETATSSATDLIEPKTVEILPPTYALTVDKTSANEGDTLTFNLVTENVDADTEIPFSFGGSISNADVLGGLKTNSFTVDANGKASLAVKFIADKFTEGAENLTLTLNSGENQSVSVKDTSITPAPVVIVKPVEVVPVVVKPVIETPTGSKGYDKKAVILSGDKLIGGEKNDTLTGNVGKDELLGKAGNDKLIGLGGNDTLIGESGNDDLNGGEGLDSLSGGSGNDLLDGGNGNDTLQGDQGNDTLKGGFGVDNMDGGDGDDYYFVDNSKDVVSEANKNTLGGNDTIESTSTYTLGKNIENLVLAGIDNNNGKGNELNNQITGNIGDNKLEGMAGNDTLFGKDGADTLDGGKGKDTLIGGNDDDIYIINNDFDTVTEEQNGGEQDQIWASVDYDLNQSLFVEVLILSGAAITGVGDEANNSLMEVENGKIANHFVGNGGDDTISSEGGNDTIEGGAGDDEIDGGIGTQDIAIFYSKKENYQITRNPDADGVDQITVRYVGNGENGEINEGEDILTNIELLQFADYDFNNPIHTDTIQITGLPA